MNIKYIDMQTFIREKIKDVGLSKKATSIALGIAISRMLPLPSTVVESPEMQYTTTLKQTATIMANDFNENIIIDVDLVAETARSYWLIRYTCAHPDISVPMISVGDFGFVSKINNVGRYINLDTYNFCDTNSEIMIVLVNRITRIMKD